MSIFTVNRQQYNQREVLFNLNNNPPTTLISGGTGLPFYTNQLSQARYGFNNVRNGLGGIYVPSNKLPTFQVATKVQDAFVYLIKVSNDNDTPDDQDIEIPFANNFYKKCYESIFPFIIQVS